MGRKVNRGLLWALAVSLALHLWLFGAGGAVWFTPVPELAFPIEASLLAPEPARSEPEPPVPPPARPAAAAPEPVLERVPEPVPEEPPRVPGPGFDTDAMPVRLPEPAVTAPAAVSPMPPVPERAPARAATRSLADHLVIHYSVQTGEGDSGFVAGRATYLWRSRNGRYSLVSTLEATGLASLFVSGRIIQVSEGGVDATGLHPEQYWLQRNERKQDVARFNWDLNHLVLEGRSGAVLSPQAQDLLSFPFHLAMTAREGEADFALGVTNGRKFNEYDFRVLGRERIELRGQTLDTLHLQGVRAGDGTLDVWLDLGRSGLPARIRTLDRKGKVMELRLEGVEQAAAGSGG